MSDKPKLDTSTLLHAAMNLATALSQPDLWWVFYDLMDGKPLRRVVPLELQRDLIRYFHSCCVEP